MKSSAIRNRKPSVMTDRKWKVTRNQKRLSKTYQHSLRHVGGTEGGTILKIITSKYITVIVSIPTGMENLLK